MQIYATGQKDKLNVLTIGACAIAVAALLIYDIILKPNDVTVR